MTEEEKAAVKAAEVEAEADAEEAEAEEVVVSAVPVVVPQKKVKSTKNEELVEYAISLGELKAKVDPEIYEDFKELPLKQRVAALQKVVSAMEKIAEKQEAEKKDGVGGVVAGKVAGKDGKAAKAALDKSGKVKDPTQVPAGKKQPPKTLLEQQQETRYEGNKYLSQIVKKEGK